MTNEHSTPQISIVTSVYNGERFLAECIESIQQQTFADFEFILVDDGSRDRSWEIIQQYAAKDPRIVALRNPVNQGVVAGLNRGLAAARGRYIARQDGDDVSLPERLRMQKDFLDAHPDYGLTGCYVTYVDENDAPLPERINPFRAVEDEDIQARLVDHMCLCGPTLMLRSETLAAAGKWFGNGMDASEDYDLCLRVAEVTRLYNVPQELYLYRQHSKSASVAQEHRQALHKAAALEQALPRRPGQESKIRPVLGKDYLWTAVLAHSQGDQAAACFAIQKAQEYYPPALNDPDLLERFLLYRAPAQAQPAIEYLNSFFYNHLPRTKTITYLQKKLVSSIHMKEVFIGARTRDRQRVKRHLWKGLRENPAWIANKGVLSIALRYLLAPDKPSQV